MGDVFLESFEGLLELFDGGIELEVVVRHSGVLEEIARDLERFGGLRARCSRQSKEWRKGPLTACRSGVQRRPHGQPFA